MHKAWNAEKGYFGQSYEETDVVDSSLMIMPLVFFSTPVCPARVDGVDLDVLTLRCDPPGRPSILGNIEAYLEDARKRRVDFQCPYLCMLSITMAA